MTVEKPTSPPFQTGDSLVVRIVDLAFGGEGVARPSDFVVFVPFALPGEEAEIVITEVRKQHARGRLVQLLERSPDRVTPCCPYFGVCGGCQYQHLRYERQLEVKQHQVLELLRRVGGFANPRVDAPAPCPEPYGYRNRIMVRTQWHGPEQRLVIGFLRHDSRLVVDVENCAIADAALNARLAEVRKAPPSKGGLKVTLRIMPDDWRVPPDSFFQNNFHLLPRLVGVVAGCLADSGIRHLVDAYCGVGFFGISLAAQVQTLIGLELDKPAISAARANAKARGVEHAEFVCGSVEDLLPGTVQRLDPAQTAVILDPPRRGCHVAGLNTLLASAPAQVVYISCQPATLARDLKHLCQSGAYRLEKLIPLDMFPQTQHIECVADLRRATPSPTTRT